jgi:hypothetical protein
LFYLYIFTNVLCFELFGIVFNLRKEKKTKDKTQRQSQTNVEAKSSNLPSNLSSMEWCVDETERSPWGRSRMYTMWTCMYVARTGYFLKNHPMLNSFGHSKNCNLRTFLSWPWQLCRRTASSNGYRRTNSLALPIGIY